MVWRRRRRVRAQLDSVGADLVEAVVVDAEVVGELVEDGTADLGDELFVGSAHRFEGTAKDEDAVGEGEVVTGGADGEGGALVEAEEGAAGADAGGT